MTTENPLDSATQTAQAQSETPTADQTAQAQLDPVKLQQELDAAQREAKMWKGRLEKVHSSLKDEKEEPKKKAAPSNSIDLDEVDWRIQHADELKVFGSTFKDLTSKGLDRDEALELARLKHAKDNPEEVTRQAANSTPGAVAHRPSSDTLTTEQLAAAQRMGIKPEKYKEYAKKAEQIIRFS